MSDGLILEFGVKTGGTITRIASQFPERTVYGFDWFYGLTEDWSKVKKGGLSMGGMPPDNLPENVELVVGLIEETLVPFLEEHPETVDFVHIDTDTYSPAKFVLDKLADRLRVGTLIVFDEFWNYKDFEEYEYKAFNEFLASHPGIKFHDMPVPFPIGFNSFEEKAFRVCTVVYD